MTRTQFSISILILVLLSSAGAQHGADPGDQSPASATGASDPRNDYVPTHYFGYQHMTVDDDNHNGIPDFADYEATNTFPANRIVMDKRAAPAQSWLTFTYEESPPDAVRSVVDGATTVYLPGGNGIGRLWSINGDQDRDIREIDQGGHFIKSGKKYPADLFYRNRHGDIVYFNELLKQGTIDVQVLWDSDLDDEIDAEFKIRYATGDQQATGFDELGMALAAAVDASDHGRVQTLLSEGASPDYRIDREAVIIRAVKNGDTVMVHQLIKLGARINTVDKDGRTPLYKAVSHGYSDMVSIILDEADPDFSRRYPFNNDALIAAIENNDLPIADRLIEHGANLANANDRFGYEAFKRALRHQDFPRIDALFKHGADPDAGNDESLLHIAVRNRSIQQVSILLAHGLDPNKTEHGKPDTVLGNAVAGDDPTIVELLLQKGADPNVADSHGTTLLHRALSQGNTQIAALLLEAGADIEARDDRGNTALLIALSRLRHHHTRDDYQRKLAMVKLLLDHGADVLTKPENGVTALQWAQKHNNIQVLEWMLAAGADPFMAMVGERMPVAEALEHGRLQQVTRYLESDAASKIRTLDPAKVITAVGEALTSHYYSARDRELIHPMRLLLAQDISPYDSDSNSKNLIDYAIEADKYHLTLMLDFQHVYSNHYTGLRMSSLYRELTRAIRDNDADAIRHCLSQGVIVYYASAEQAAQQHKLDRLLFDAIRYADADILQLLLQAGLSPDVTNPVGGTSLLEYARNRGDDQELNIVILALADVRYVATMDKGGLFHTLDSEIDAAYDQGAFDLAWDVAAMYSPTIRKITTAYQGAKFLDHVIRTYADVNQASDYHLPIIAAAAYGNREHIQLLIERGADVNKIDPHSGKTALMTTVLYGKDDNARLLIQSGADPSIKSSEGLTAADYAHREKRTAFLQLQVGAASAANR